MSNKKGNTCTQISENVYWEICWEGYNYVLELLIWKRSTYLFCRKIDPVLSQQKPRQSDKWPHINMMMIITMNQVTSQANQWTCNGLVRISVRRTSMSASHVYVRKSQQCPKLTPSVNTPLNIKIRFTEWIEFQSQNYRFHQEIPKQIGCQCSKIVIKILLQLKHTARVSYRRLQSVMPCNSFLVEHYPSVCLRQCLKYPPLIRIIPAHDFKTRNRSPIPTRHSYLSNKRIQNLQEMRQSESWASIHSSFQGR